ncbi:MAG: T9SS type A sorting domain-containing protein [Prevotella sp.]|nr:T9SS type A sorting domain-containing protein [Muribaculaceae bacterium]MBQ5496816.1 T9SS type A sorting domain-containing protein [Prevotella sp.]
MNNGQIIVTAADACNACLQVVDVMGRIVVSTDVARNVSTSEMTPGVYVLRLINGNNVRTQKIVIK